jgi:hypothetical protein
VSYWPSCYLWTRINKPLQKELLPLFADLLIPISDVVHDVRFEAVQEQVDNLLQALRRSQMSEMDYLHTVENLQRAEQEVSKQFLIVAAIVNDLVACNLF